MPSGLQFPLNFPLDFDVGGVEHGPINALVTIGDLVSASRLAAYTRSSSSIFGVLASASRSWGTARAASILVGETVSASRTAAYVRNSTSAIGVSTTASKLFEAIRNSAVTHGVVTSASRTYESARSAAVEVGQLVSASRIQSSVRSAAIIVGQIISASRLYEAVRLSSVIQGVMVSASKLADYIRTTDTIVFTDTTIDTAEIVPNEAGPTTFDVSADPTAVIPNGSMIKVGADAEQMLVTGAGSGISEIGSNVVPNDSSFMPVYTLIAQGTAAPVSGTLTTAYANLTNYGTSLLIGIFRQVAGSTYRCIASQNTGAHTNGLNTKVVSLPVSAGDYIGMKFSTGNARILTGSGGNILYYLGEAIDPNDEADYIVESGWKLALWGEITTPNLTVNRAQNGTVTAEHASEENIYIGSLVPGIIFGIVPSASRLFESARLSSVAVGITTSASKIFGYVRSASIIVGIAVTATFTRRLILKIISALSTLFRITPSTSTGLTITSSFSTGLTITSAFEEH